MLVRYCNAFALPLLIIISLVFTIFSQDTSKTMFRVESGINGYILHNEIIDKNFINSISLSVLIPTTLNKTSLRFGADIGKLHGDVTSYNTNLLLANISILYAIPLQDPRFCVSPSLSLLNCALHLHPSGKIDDFAIIANWENEFGVGAGAEFSFLYKRFVFYMPCSFSTIFSLNPAYLFSCGLRIGIRFNTTPDKML